jgi:hypothetical protein
VALRIDPAAHQDKESGQDNLRVYVATAPTLPIARVAEDVTVRLAEPVPEEWRRLLAIADDPVLEADAVAAGEPAVAADAEVAAGVGAAVAGEGGKHHV